MPNITATRALVGGTVDSQSSPMTMEKLVSLCKRRGFLFQSSEIYGGLNGFWDYGPLGVELKRNIKEAWWRDMVSGHDDISTPDNRGQILGPTMRNRDSGIGVKQQLRHRFANDI